MSEGSPTKKRKTILRECRLFAALSDDELEKIAGFTAEKEYLPGDVIFEVGNSAQELLVVQEGRIALQMTLPVTPSQMGRRVTVDVVGEREVLGWSAIVEPHFYTLTAVCLQKARVIAISGSELRALLREQTNIGYQVLRGLSRVVASRLEDTRQVLISERLLTGHGLEHGAKSRISGH